MLADEREWPSRGDGECAGTGEFMVRRRGGFQSGGLAFPSVDTASARPTLDTYVGSAGCSPFSALEGCKDKASRKLEPGLATLLEANWWEGGLSCC